MRLGKLTFHMGADYACVMGSKQTTEDAVARLYGQSHDIEAYGKLFASAPDVLAILKEGVATIKAFDDAMACQGEHSHDAKLIVMANYGDLAINALKAALKALPSVHT